MKTVLELAMERAAKIAENPPLRKYFETFPAVADGKRVNMVGFTKQGALDVIMNSTPLSEVDDKIELESTSIAIPEFELKRCFSFTYAYHVHVCTIGPELPAIDCPKGYHRDHIVTNPPDNGIIAHANCLEDPQPGDIFCRGEKGWGTFERIDDLYDIYQSYIRDVVICRWHKDMEEALEDLISYNKKVLEHMPPIDDLDKIVDYHLEFGFRYVLENWCDRIVPENATLQELNDQVYAEGWLAKEDVEIEMWPKKPKSSKN